jgi:outer membrane lipoprotein-sorting protein
MILGIKKGRLVCFLLFLLFLSSNIGAQDVIAILDKAVSVCENSNGLTAQFTMFIRSDRQQISESFEGVIDVKGEKFVLKTPDMSIWFDGRNQWTYLERNEEVNVTLPSDEELQMTNPILSLRFYKKGFNAIFKGESTAANGKTCWDIELVPKKKKDIDVIELQIEKKSSIPVLISIVTKQGIHNTIRINEMKTGVNQSDSCFIFEEKEYPNAEIIDLR